MDGIGTNPIHPIITYPPPTLPLSSSGRPVAKVRKLFPRMPVSDAPLQDKPTPKPRTVFTDQQPLATVSTHSSACSAVQDKRNPQLAENAFQDLPTLSSAIPEKAQKQKADSLQTLEHMLQHSSLTKKNIAYIHAKLEREYKTFNGKENCLSELDEASQRQFIAKRFEVRDYSERGPISKILASDAAKSVNKVFVKELFDNYNYEGTVHDKNKK